MFVASSEPEAPAVPALPASPASPDGVSLEGVSSEVAPAVPECVDASRYRRAELLKRTFGIDVETCPRCGGRMQLLAVITDLASAARLRRHQGDPTEPRSRAPARAPPYWQSKIVRRHGQFEQSSQLGLFEEH